jgi:hypothetical protein
MTIEAIVRLTLFNVMLAVVGTAVLVAMRPGTSRRDWLRLSGVSYLLGVAALMVVLTLSLVVSIPVTFASIVVAGLSIFAAGGAIARRRRSSAEDQAERVSTPLLSIPSAAVLALAIVCLEAIFRKGRLQGLIEFDGWDSWGPKAEQLYFFHRLDASFLHDLPGGSYPPGVPAILAAGLHAIGSADMVTVHLQYWFLGAGFVAAFVGVLSTRVTPLVLAPFALLVFVIPDIRSRSVDMYGDLPLGFLLAAGALLIALWLDRPQRWYVPAAALLFAGAVLSKREGIVLVACVVLAALVASADRVKHVWRQLLLVCAPSIAVWVLWQIWVAAKGLPSNGPEGGLHFLTDLGRGWNAFVAVKNNLFDYDLRLLSTTIAIGAVAVCLLAHAWRVAAYLGGLIVFTTLGCTAILWSDQNLQLDDINVVSRLVGGVTLMLVVVAPLALQRAWEECGPIRPLLPEPSRPLRLAVAGGLIAAAAIAYPAVLLAGGGARFPRASDCVVKPSDAGNVDVVFGHVESYADALRVRDRAATAGLPDVAMQQDGCGKLRVFVARPANAANVLQRARAVGLKPTLEAAAAD